MVDEVTLYPQWILKIFRCLSSPTADNLGVSVQYNFSGSIWSKQKHNDGAAAVMILVSKIASRARVTPVSRKLSV